MIVEIAIYRQGFFHLNMLRAALFVCLLSLSQLAYALSGITITADKITYDGATLHKTNIALDLTDSDIAIVQAETLEYGKARLDKAHITIDLKPTQRC